MLLITTDLTIEPELVSQRSMDTRVRRAVLVWIRARVWSQEINLSDQLPELESEPVSLSKGFYFIHVRFLARVRAHVHAFRTLLPVWWFCLSGNKCLYKYQYLGCSVIAPITCTLSILNDLIFEISKIIEMLRFISWISSFAPIDIRYASL